MRGAEEDIVKEDTIKKQLTLSMVVWDVHHLEKEETEKYRRELVVFDILQKVLPENLDCQSAYQWLIAHSFAANTVLVTENARLADYIYQAEEDVSGQGVQAKPGVAVLYYERDRKKKARADFVVQGFEEIGVQFLDRVLKRRNHLPWNILYTKRTCVREIALSDMDDLFALYQGEGITDYIEPLYERSQEEVYTENYVNHMYYFYGYGMWVIRDIKTGALIGRAGIEHRSVDTETLMELGYVVGKKFQRQGYGYEVCNAILDYATEQLCMEELHCFIHPDNDPSIMLARKLGFESEHDSLEQQGVMLHFKRKLGAACKETVTDLQKE